MDNSVGDEREVRAARNESLFRTVNESVRALNETFATITDLFTVMCECADVRCTETVSIPHHDYLAARFNERRFVVRRDADARGAFPLRRGVEGSGRRASQRS